MKSFILATVLSAALALPAMAASKPAGDTSKRAANNQTAVACNICYTCGGDWPVFSGSIRSVGDFPTERAGSCSSTLSGRSDSSPYLCCR